MSPSLFSYRRLTPADTGTLETFYPLGRGFQANLQQIVKLSDLIPGS